MEGGRTQTDSSADEMKLIVRLSIYESAHAQDDDANQATDFEAWVTRGGSVAELKAVLESQDLIPEDSDQFDIQVRLSETSPPLGDSSTIPETTTHVLLAVRPKRTDDPTATTTAAQHFQTPPETVPPRFSGPSSLVASSAMTPEDWAALLASARLLTPAAATFASSRPSPPPPRDNQVPSSSATTPSFMAAQLEAAQNIIADPNAMRQLMSSPFMRAMMSNPELLRTIIEANPQMRELRERNPELNHILNDPQLFRESMEAMQNPSLMREMISNTDRALRNIDAVPGGFNALRNVYESIQEPMWAAATSSTFGRNSSDGGGSKTYDLRTDQGPSTEAIPSPWATRPPPPLPPPPRLPASTTTAMRPSAPSTIRAGQSADTSQRTLVTVRPTPSHAQIVGNSTSPPAAAPSTTLQVATPAPQPTTTTTPTDAVATGLVTSPKRHDGQQTAPSEPREREHDSAAAEVTSASAALETQKQHPAAGGDEPSDSQVRPPLQDASPPEAISETPLLPAAGQYPYLYQSVFPSQHRLRSLGGLGLPHAAHIQGVIHRQPPPGPSTRSENDSTSDSETSHSDKK